MAEVYDRSAFFFRGGDTGVLLIHGFTGSPLEMRPLGDFLASCGYTVSGVRLAGHGSSEENMARTRCRDWIGSAEDALLELKGQCQKVFVAGLSMGGVIALNLSTRHEVDGLICMSTPAFLKDPRMLILPIARLFVRYLPVLPSDLQDPEARKWFSNYRRMPTACVQSLMRLIRVTRRLLPMVRVPVLFIQGGCDRTIPPASLPYMLEHIGSATKESIVLPGSGHGVTADVDKETLFESVDQFISSIATSSSVQTA